MNYVLGIIGIIVIILIIGVLGYSVKCLIDLHKEWDKEK